jgi:uncharacterized membrane protein YfcA
MALVGLLRTEGPLTATRAAELLGESSGTTSFHLRQLAKYGLVGLLLGVAAVGSLLGALVTKRPAARIGAVLVLPTALPRYRLPGD